MKNSARFFIFSVFVYFNLFLCLKNTYAIDEEEQPNVVIITLMSTRRSDTLGSKGDQYMPKFLRKIVPEGTLYTHLVDENLQFHMPSYQAIQSGLIHDSAYGDMRGPSLMQYIRKQLGWHETKVWSMGHMTQKDCVLNTDDYGDGTYPSQITRNFSVSKSLLELLDPGEKTLLDDFEFLLSNKMSSRSAWDSMGPVRFTLFKKVWHAYKPKFVHLLLEDVESAHYDKLSRYLLSLKYCDDRISEIWELIQSDPFYKGKTYLFISPDHSRNLYYMHHYENARDNPSLIWLYVYGPDVKKGVKVRRPVSHCDIFATIAELLKLKVPVTQGERLHEAFRQRKERGSGS